MSDPVLPAPPVAREIPKAPVSVAHGSVLLLASTIVRAAGFFVAALLLARGLGPAGRGSVAFITVTALVSSRIATVGVGQATSVLAAQRPGARAMLLSNLVAFSVAASLAVGIIVAGGLYLLNAGPAGNDRTQLALLAPAVVAASLVDDSFLIGCGRLREAAAISAIGGWVYVGSIVAVIVTQGLSVDSAVLAWVGAHLVWGTMLAGVGLRTAGLSRPNPRLLAESVRFGVRAWVGTASLFLNARLDQILMGFIATEAVLGLYAVAVNCAEILLFLPTAIAKSLLPAVARTQDLTSVERTLRTFRSAVILASGSVIVAAGLGWVAIPRVFGPAYRDSVAPFMWLLPGTFGYTALSIFSNSLLASRAPGLSSFGSLAALVSGLLLDVALIPSLGAAGAAAAASVAFLAGGATVAALYRWRTTGFAWGELVPAGEDLRFLRLVASRLLVRGGGAA